MSVPPVAVDSDSVAAVLGNALSFWTAALGHCEASVVDFTMHARDAVAVPRCQLPPEAPRSVADWWPERESEMTGGVTSWVAKAPTARRRQSFIVILK